MPALNFKKRFAPLVRDGEKRQTIRALRKDGRDPKPGDTLYLYTGMRTKACSLLRRETCARVAPVVIFPDSANVGRIDLLPEQREAFARADGFGSYDELVDWFQHEARRTFPWCGLVIYW